ncbi:DUF397 domain-containing protein [Streptomyces sp. NPDC003077]|uniref:DUF397 domain-containing protein n=1 Tax=Streptomyces sp. NPDC003077 TaxID=3154443 RepID=UPI0033B05BDD
MKNLYAVDLSEAAWRVSSYTAGEGNCVEIASITDASQQELGVAIRDSKNRGIPAARVTTSAWSAFLAAVTSDTLQSR